MRGAGAVQQLGCRVAALLGDGEQQVFGRDELVLETPASSKRAPGPRSTAARGTFRAACRRSWQVADEPPGLRTMASGCTLHLASTGRTIPSFSSASAISRCSGKITWPWFCSRPPAPAAMPPGLLSQLVQPKHCVPL